MVTTGGRSVGHACGRRDDHRRRQREPAHAALALPAEGEADALGRLRVDAGSRRRHRLRAGPEQHRLRARPCGRQCPLGTPLPGAERGAERARGRRRTRLRRDRLRRVRARRRVGPGTLAPPSGERARALRRHRAGPVEGARVPQHPRLRTLRPRRDLRARRRDRPRDLEVRHDREAVALPARGGRRRGLVPGLRRRRRAAVRGQREPDTLGRHAGAPERRRLPRPGALDRIR